MIEEKNETGSKPTPINDSVIPPRRSDESLLEELLDQRRLRTEREHAAAREINALRSQLRTSKERIANQVALLERQQADSLFLVQQNQKLAEQLAAAELDAERYRYFCGHLDDTSQTNPLHIMMARIGSRSPTKHELDEAIDAAIAAQKGEK